MTDAQNLFRKDIAEFIENGLESELFGLDEKKGAQFIPKSVLRLHKCCVFTDAKA